ncbi:MAG: dockerin type I domain-containing protein [Planctomycetota bacterium]|nr:dockerin type I domain-containing protein [Planctomycetota bacterium]
MSDLQPDIPTDSDLQAPPAFARDLKALYTSLSAIPPATDEAILTHTQRRSVGRRRTRLLLRWAVPPAAAAAVIMWVVFNPFTAPDVENSPFGEAAGMVATRQLTDHRDIDGNGRVNILDALALARNIKDNRVADRMWDFNGDGLIDRKDVDTVAQSAVSLNKGTSS